MRYVTKTSSAGRGLWPPPRDGNARTITSRSRAPSWITARCPAYPDLIALARSCRADPRLPHFALDATAFSLGQAAPDPKPLVVLKRVLKALAADLATPADPLGLPGGAALLWEERLRVRLRTERPVLPTQVIHVLRTDHNLR